MIYMEPVSLGWMPILVSWLNTLPPSFTDHLKNHLHEMYSRFCPCLLQLIHVCKVRERFFIPSYISSPFCIYIYFPSSFLLQEIITMPDANLVKSTTYLFDCFVDDYYDEKYCHMMTDLDMRAQVEVNSYIRICIL